LVVVAAAFGCAPLVVQAQDVDSPISAAPGETGGPVAATQTVTAIGPADASEPRAPAADLGNRATVPALTEVAIEILADLGSRTSQQGDTFPLRLAAPVVIDGVELIPAGTPGVGEVIHAKKSGGSGAAGELVLAARYLEVGGARLPLRSLRFDATAKDRMRTVETIELASAAVMPVASFIGFFIKGDQLSLASGSVLTAKTAADFVVEIAAPSPDPIDAIAEAGNAEVAATAEATAISSATGEEIQ
jgi:hypothetical protein